LLGSLMPTFSKSMKSEKRASPKKAVRINVAAHDD
jgi:hypothetical protein